MDTFLYPRRLRDARLLAEMREGDANSERRSARVIGLKREGIPEEVGDELSAVSAEARALELPGGVKLREKTGFSPAAG